MSNSTSFLKPNTLKDLKLVFFFLLAVLLLLFKSDCFFYYDTFSLAKSHINPSSNLCCDSNDKQQDLCNYNHTTVPGTTTPDAPTWSGRLLAEPMYLIEWIRYRPYVINFFKIQIVPSIGFVPSGGLLT